tara:strand:- start:42 stop:263 length:222 start_codon:yes stop_codon:yes gene_type:complete
MLQISHQLLQINADVSPLKPVRDRQWIPPPEMDWTQDLQAGLPGYLLVVWAHQVLHLFRHHDKVRQHQPHGHP